MVKVEEIKFQGGDLKAFEVFHPSGASVKVCPFGATVYSFKDAKNEEHLFLSKASRIDASKPYVSASNISRKPARISRLTKIN